MSATLHGAARRVAECGKGDAPEAHAEQRLSGECKANEGWERVEQGGVLMLLGCADLWWRSLQKTQGPSKRSWATAQPIPGKTDRQNEPLRDRSALTATALEQPGLPTPILATTSPRPLPPPFHGGDPSHASRDRRTGAERAGARGEARGVRASGVPLDPARPGAPRGDGRRVPQPPSERLGPVRLGP